MAAVKYQNSMSVLTPGAKAAFFQDCLQKQKELGKYQREYKKILSRRLKTRADLIFEESYPLACERLHCERNDLKAQIWVANGQPHRSADQRHLKQIKCHIKCQERLCEDIKLLKSDISNLEREIGHNDKVIYELNLKTVPDSRHQDHVERARKKIILFENSLEVGVRLESKFTSMNSELREEVKKLLSEQASFNRAYSAMVQKLSTDKKYLSDLLEYATNTFEGAIEMSEKLSASKRKVEKESEQAKMGVQSVMRNMAAAELVYDFMCCKNKTRKLADLQPSEYRRRNTFKRNHLHKISLYTKVLDKILKYADAHNIDTITEKYQYQEGLYYSYFTYVTNTGYHITLLDQAINRLYKNVVEKKIENRAKSERLDRREAELDARLQERQQRNEMLQNRLSSRESHLHHYLEKIGGVFDMCQANAMPLTELLGDHTRVNRFNVRRFCEILESRLLDIVRSVYVMERHDPDMPLENYTVKAIEKFVDFPTRLNDIVLTQQCPECAEGETYNIDDDGAGVAVRGIDETKQKLSDSVNQPEMQYRLHSISQCRLPRSRLLAAKRHNA